MPLTEATPKVSQFRFQSLTIPILAGKKSLNHSPFSFACHSRYIIIVVIIIIIIIINRPQCRRSNKL